VPKLRLKAPTAVVADYFRLFVNRRAYTLQSNRPHPESAQHYYHRPKDKKTGSAGPVPQSGRPAACRQDSGVRSQNEEHVVRTICSDLHAFRFLLIAWALLSNDKPQSFWGARLYATCCSMSAIRALFDLRL
jgi:hypothetical protein